MKSAAKKLIVFVVVACGAGWLLLDGSAFAASSSGGGGKFVVVINAKNPIKGQGKSVGELRQLVKRLYLKERSTWPNGSAEAKPFSRPSDAEEQAVLIKHVLQMSEAELAAHWMSLKQKNGTTPPRKVKSERMLMKFIGKFDGGFGVASAESAQKLGDDLAVLFEIPSS